MLIDGTGGAHRRLLIAGAAAALFPAALPPGSCTDFDPPLAARLGSPASLRQPLRDLGVPTRSGPLHYPKWLLGTWHIRNSIAAFHMPLGTTFADSFELLSATSDVKSEVRYGYTLRWVPDESLGSSYSGSLCAVQDRAFNAAEETVAFIDDNGVAVERCSYSTTTGAGHGVLDLQLQESGAGAAGRTAIELSVEWCQWQTLADGAFVTDELVLQRVTNGVESPSESLIEILTRFEPGPRSTPGAAPTQVRARNRIAQYLLPPRSSGIDVEPSVRAAALYKLAGGRAITMYDYDWLLSCVGGDELPYRSSPV